jgi:hypothetical protein
LGSNPDFSVVQPERKTNKKRKEEKTGVNKMPVERGLSPVSNTVTGDAQGDWICNPAQCCCSINPLKTKRIYFI